MLNKFVRGHGVTVGTWGESGHKYKERFKDTIWEFVTYMDFKAINT